MRNMKRMEVSSFLLSSQELEKEEDNDAYTKLITEGLIRTSSNDFD
jgi:hypothetical protein